MHCMQYIANMVLRTTIHSQNSQSLMPKVQYDVKNYQPFTTQASVELSHVQEQLLTEKHVNELRTKSLVSDIERRASREEHAQHAFAVREKALQAIIRAYEGHKSPKVIHHMKGKLTH